MQDLYVYRSNSRKHVTDHAGSSIAPIGQDELNHTDGDFSALKYRAQVGIDDTDFFLCGV